MEKQSLYAAFQAKDARFDGRFFVGISSTGIYCRPVCRAKRPKAENCTFYITAAEAEQAGYRPCLLCRPELAPGTSPTDATANLVYRAARLLEENCGSGENLTELAQQLGCTDRHLRRVFVAEYNVSPVKYLQTCRLLLAKNLLTDTHLPVIEIAMSAGFGSLRRFNTLFKKHYHLSPTALRKQCAEEQQQDSITLTLGYRPPYQWKQMLKFLAEQAIPGVEVVEESKYMRTVHFVTARQEHRYGWLKVWHKPEKTSLAVTISEGLLPALPQVLARLRHLFDLSCEPYTVYEALSPMNEVRPHLCVLGTRLPGSFNTFEIAVGAVLRQQTTGKAASVLMGRISAACGVSIQTGIEGLGYVFPSPEKILALKDTVEKNLDVLGVSSTQASAIYQLAQAVVQKDINLDYCVYPEEEIKKLMCICGIGNRAAQYIAMRAMQWTDAFLETDADVKKALPHKTPKELLSEAETWRPWRSYAVIGLWNAL